MTDERDTKESVKSINGLRKEFGMKPIVYTDKPCMRCGREFRSQGAHNRLCLQCKDPRISAEYIYNISI